MGTLANSLFQTLLGWIRALAVEIWNTFSGSGETTLIRWLGDHWKFLAAALCAAGLIIDPLIYLFRWQPYRVWRSRRAEKRMRRQKRQTDRRTAGEEEIPGDPAEELAPAILKQESELFVRREAGPDPYGETDRAEWEPDAPDPGRDETAAAEGFRQGAEPAFSEQAGLPGAENRPAFRNGEQDDRRFRRPAERYAAGIYMNEAEEAEALRREEGAEAQPREERPESRTEAFDRALRPRRRRRVREMLTDAGEKTAPRPDQLIDRNEAYREPVYPRSWGEENAP